MNHYGNGELYNLKKDPSEVHNLFGEKKYSEIQTELLTRLLAWELRLQDPLPLPQRRYHFKQNPFNYLHREFYKIRRLYIPTDIKNMIP